jgi:hypothetical protein
LSPRSGDTENAGAPLASLCTDDLENVLHISSCPVTYAAETDGPNQLCRDYGDSFQVASGPAHSFIRYAYGAGSTACVYDASNSALVGMTVSDDSNYFCHGTSNVVQAGDLGEADLDLAVFRPLHCSDSDLPPAVGSPSPPPRACPGGIAPAFLTPTSDNRQGNFTLAASEVYWSEFYGIWHVPKAGGNGLPVIEDERFHVVSSDAEALYWSRLPVGASPPSLFRLPFGSQSEPQRIVDDASDAWAVSGSQLYYLSSNGQLRAVPTAGGASTLLAEGAGSSQALAADATGIYWYAELPGTPAESISKYTFTTGLVTAFAPVTGGARFVQTASEHVLWADAAGVWSSTWDGERTSLSTASSVRGLSSDGTKVYWAQSSGPDDVFSDVLQVPLAGGDAATIACHLYLVRSLRADGTAVYYDTTLGDVIGKVTLE